MISGVLERRTTIPENGLPSFKHDYSIHENCLGHQPVVKITRLHDVKKKSKICGIDWTCDGRKLVYSARDSIQLMNPQTCMAEVNIPGQWFKAIPSRVNRQQLICIPLNKPFIEFYDLRGCTSHFEIRIPSDSFLNVAWSHDGKTVVTGDKTDNLYSVDLRFPKSSKLPLPIIDTTETEKKIERREVPFLIRSHRKSQEEINDIIFSEDDRSLIMARNDGKLEVIRLEAPRDIFSKNKSELIQTHLYSSSIVRESSNLVASFGQDQTVSLINLESMSIRSSLGGVDGSVPSLDFNKSGEILAVGVASDRRKTGEDSNDTLVLCNNTLKILSRFDIPGRISSLSWHPYRHILSIACNSLEPGGSNNTSSSNSGANMASIHYNKTISSGLNGQNTPFIGFMTIE
ncbi:WD40/YVTN repeat-like-containing protein [Cryptosporidium felis]|nr:WD40/YVTN repeat-like-containing protein [Cryptosporidium felis]